MKNTFVISINEYEFFVYMSERDLFIGRIGAGIGLFGDEIITSKLSNTLPHSDGAEKEIFNHISSYKKALAKYKKLAALI